MQEALNGSEQDLQDVHSPHDDALGNAMVSRVLVDNEFGVNIFFKDATEKMRILNNISRSKITIHTFNETLI